MLSKDERRNIFFNTFSKSWKDAFKRAAHDVTNLSNKVIQDWMSTPIRRRRRNPRRANRLQATFARSMEDINGRLAN